MFDTRPPPSADPRSAVNEVLTTADVEGFLAGLARLDVEVSDAERLRQIELLEALKGAAAGAQARVTRAFVASQRAAQAEAGVPARRVGLGVIAQVGLARRESPVRAERHVGLAAVLPEMPHTREALAAGRIQEWRAMLIARATATLSLEHRREVDARLAERLPGLSDRAADAAARAIAGELDSDAPVRAGRRAAKDRYVSVRPAPDVMTFVTAFLPMVQGVAVEKALRQAVAGAHADPADDRTAGQVRADTLFTRVTGLAHAGDVPLEVGLVMTDTTLLAGGTTPGRIEGYGPVPASFLRALLRDEHSDTTRGQHEAPSGGPARDEHGSRVEGADPADAAEPARRRAQVWIRRLFVDPVDGSLAACDARRRRFTGALRDYVIARDQYCRTPWCDAPVRAADHVLAWAHAGATDARNGQGLCIACNLAKEAPGWTATATGRHDSAHAVTTTTPTGRQTTSLVPPVLPTYRPPPHLPWYRRVLWPPDPDDPDDPDGCPHPAPAHV